MVYNKGYFKWIVCILFSICLILEPAAASIYAQEGEPEAAEDRKTIITEIDGLPEDTAVQQFAWPASEADILLPAQLMTDQGEIAVEWQQDIPFDRDYIGTYTFTPVFSESYTVEAPLPCIRVIVSPAKTKVSGINFNRSGKAGTTLTDTVKVSPAYGAEIHLQQKSGNKWVTRGTYTAADQGSAEVTLTYTKNWYTKESSTWRVYVPERSGAAAFKSKSIKVTAKRVYQNPSKYLQIKQTVTVEASGAYKLKRGTMGLKVARVQRRLGMGHRWEIMDTATISKVKTFQKKKGLKANGVVDLKTWKKMGYSEATWSSMGKYVSPVKVKMTSNRKQCVETMISRAKSYLGDEYIVGAAGKPGTGVDCSGLVMQSMYSAGLNPLPVSVVRHAQPGYEYESRNLWAHKKLKHVKYSDKKRGDLIFYRGKGGTIVHVAIYLGNGKVIESWPDKVRIWPVKNKRRSNIAGVARPFV